MSNPKTTAVANTPVAASAVLAAVNQTSGAVTGFVDTGGGIPIVKFFSNKMPDSAEVAVLVPGGLKENDPFLKDSSGVVKLNPLKYHLVRYAQHWVERDDQNKMVSASADRQSFESKKKEEIEALILVYVGDTVKPAIATFRDGRAKGASPAATLLAASATEKPDWAKRGPDFEQTLKIPIPFARFTAEVATSRKLRKSGRMQNMAESAIKATTIGDFDTLNKAAATRAFQDAYETCNKVFSKRIEEKAKLATEGTSA